MEGPRAEGKGGRGGREGQEGQAGWWGGLGVEGTSMARDAVLKQQTTITCVVRPAGWHND